MKAIEDLLNENQYNNSNYGAIVEAVREIAGRHEITLEVVGNLIINWSSIGDNILSEEILEILRFEHSEVF